MIINHQGKEIEFEDNPSWICLGCSICTKLEESSKELIKQKAIMPTAAENVSLLHGILIEKKSKFRLNGDFEGSVSDKLLSSYPIFQNTLIIYDFRKEKNQGYDAYFIDRLNISHFDDFFIKQKGKKIINPSILERKLTSASEFRFDKTKIFISKDRTLRFIPASDKIPKIGDSYGWREGEDYRDPTHRPELVAIFMGREGKEFENVEKLKQIYHEYGLFFLYDLRCGDQDSMKAETERIYGKKNGFGIYQSCIVQIPGSRAWDIRPLQYAFDGRFIRIINRKR